MAKIVPSDVAPSEVVHYSLANADFDLGGSGKGSKKAYETDSPAVIANAEAHPWLTVEHDPAAIIKGTYRETLKPEDDVLSAVNDHSNDPDVVHAAEVAAFEGDPTAIESGKDQDKVVETGGVDETLAADNADDGDKN